MLRVSFWHIVAETYVYVFIRIMEITMIKEDVGQRNAETSF